MAKYSRSRGHEELDPGSKAVKWVIAVVVGGALSGLVHVWLDRAKDTAQNAVASNPAPNAAPNPAPGAGFTFRQTTTTTSSGPAVSPSSTPTNWPKPDFGSRPSPAPAPVNPDAFKPTFSKPKTPPAATEFSGLLAYWSLDEVNGGRTTDAQRKRPATLYGGRQVPGIRGQALELNGGNECVDLGNAPELNFAAKAPFTFACWVKTEAKTGKVFWFRGHPDGLTIVGVHITDGKLQGWVRHDGGIFHPQSFGGEVTAKEPMRLGEWHHVALSRNENGEPELFQDGKSVARAAGGRETPGKITTNVRALGVDGHGLLKNPKDREVQPLQGCVDEFCVFGRVLSEEEIAKLAGRDP